LCRRAIVNTSAGQPVAGTNNDTRLTGTTSIGAYTKLGDRAERLTAALLQNPFKVQIFWKSV
jgi:hypothetical protein